MINESKLNNRMFHLMESGFFGKQLLNEAEEIKQGAYGDPYQYKRVSDSGEIKYFYAKKGDSNWLEQTKQVGIDSIKKYYFPDDLKASSEKPKTSSEKPKTSSEKSGSSGDYDAIFVAGITSGVGINGQIEYFKNGFGKDKNVAAFFLDGTPYGHKQTIAQVLADNPKIPAFLFSAGAGQVYNIASNGNADVNKIFVIEPYYAQGQTVKPKIDAAVSAGVPANHIYVGAYAAVGLGVVADATPTKSGNHFLAVTEVARKHSA